MSLRIQFSDKEPAPATLPEPEPLTANDQICASNCASSSSLTPSSAKVTLGVVSLLTILATTIMSPVSAVATVPAPSILATCVETKSFVAAARPKAKFPEPEPPPATITINGLVVDNTLMSVCASTVAPPFISALTILRIKLIEIEPPSAILPEPAPPIETLTISGLASAKTLTSPASASAVALSINDRT